MFDMSASAHAGFASYILDVLPLQSCALAPGRRDVLEQGSPEGAFGGVHNDYASPTTTLSVGQVHGGRTVGRRATLTEPEASVVTFLHARRTHSGVF